MIEQRICDECERDEQEFDGDLLLYDAADGIFLCPACFGHARAAVSQPDTREEARGER